MNHEKLLHVDLFSGIGGFALAADRVFGNVEHVFCDNEPFAQEVLKKHWPESKIYGDIRSLTYADYDGLYGTKDTEGSRARKDDHKEGADELRKPKGSHPIRIAPFILTGGFPCQPFSQAGRRKGEADDRFLWPEMCRVIGEFRPTWVIAENVRGLLTQGRGVVFERVCTDLEALGYEVQPIIIPAIAVGAPHRRDRVWFVAHYGDGNARQWGDTSCRRSEPSLKRRETATSSLTRGRNNGGRTQEGGSKISKDVSDDSDSKSNETEQHQLKTKRLCGGFDRERSDERSNWKAHWLEVATRLCRVDDGVPRRMDRNPRLKALGNAIVPQVAEEIMRAILVGDNPSKQ